MNYYVFSNLSVDVNEIQIKQGLIYNYELIDIKITHICLFLTFIQRIAIGEHEINFVTFEVLLYFTSFNF